MSLEAATRLEISRKELLDLGLRNPLINHRQRAKQVKIVDELSTEIYRLLVTDGKSMSFDALPETAIKQMVEKEEKAGGDAEAVSWEDLLAQPGEDLKDGQLASRHTDNKLQTTLVSEKLQTRLLSIHNDARTYLEEQGVNILFLALGFLHWYEAPSATEARRAPLLLIPVELTRASAQLRFHIAHTGEELGDNLSLIEKLKAEFGIELPKLGDTDDLDIGEYFAAVSKAVSGDERWSVEADEMTVGFFSFGKFLMYKDLDPEVWVQEGESGDGASILNALLTDGFREAESPFGDETHIDEVVTPAEVHQVKDADSTQILAILDVNAGRNLVLQGPPGTGKSQTITNIIAECIGNGRKVLFVAEKMAALDVVKRRLDESGLGDAVMELHSHKTNKKQVLEELNRTLHQGRPVIGDASDDIDTLTRLRNDLNAYCDAVNQPIGNTRSSFVNALGFALKNYPGDLDVEPFDFAPMVGWSEADYRQARMQVDTMDWHLVEAGSPKKNPFRSSQLTEFLPSQRPNLEKVLDGAIEATDQLLVTASDLAKAMNLQQPQLRRDAAVICRAAQRAMDAPHLEGLALTSGEWQVRRDDVSALIAAGKHLSEAHAHYDEWLIDEAWQQDLVDVRQQYVTKGGKWWKFLSGDFRRAKARLRGLCRKPLQTDVNDTITMIDTVLDSQKHQSRYLELSGLGESLFGAQWKKEGSDWEVLEKLTEWVVALYRDVGNGDVPNGIVNFLSGSPEVDELKDRVDLLEQHLAGHKEAAEQVVDLLKLKIADKAKADWDLTLEKQGAYLSHWRSHLDSLFHLIRFNLLAKSMTEQGLGFVVSAAQIWNHGEGTLVQLFDYSWYNGLVEKAYLDTPSIKMFDRAQHAHMLEEFSRLDHLLFRHNQARLAATHWQSLPKLSGSGELAVIRSEINKKRRQMPIRKLMMVAGRAIQAVKPVFMMSPMSVATYLPPGALQFDLVVFDEASQVKPVDAFGAILRGGQAVVVGDSKQLPPTSFFDSLVQSDDEEDSENVGDMESILSLFLGKGAPERMLRWHYRSRHESLIAVSNYEFYESRLVVFPSPGSNPVARGLRLHHLPKTSYDRGKSRTNPEEAKAVAQSVMAHAKATPDLTLGVVAFSTAQRDAIDSQLEVLRRADPSCEPFFSLDKREPFFVKNLENVQGDERDTIFISIGYGKTAEGYMTMGFGPLNRDGGERRLNVLISRARLAMDVFSNFTADDIDLNRTNATGVVAFKNFLAYAQTGVLQQPYSTGKEPDSPFEEVVIKSLVSRGVEIEPQVGSAGFFIDLAVKDKENPGRYVLGIECDGATYHSSRSARDRDRLRQEVLEGLGWRLHRIWSTDWYRNPEQEVERALAAIEQAKLEYRAGITAQPKVEVASADVAPIHREEASPESDENQTSSIVYKKAPISVPLGAMELHEFPPQRLLPYVAAVVDIESPVHKTEVIRRIVEGAGLGRAGNRIQDAVNNAIRYGVRENKVQVKGDFLWHPDMDEPEVRDRSLLDNTSKKFEFVSPEELRMAIRKEVENGFTLSTDGAVSSAARALGFQRVTKQAKERFEAELESMIQAGTLVSKNGLLSTA